MAHHRKPPDRLSFVLVGGPVHFRPDDADWIGGVVREVAWPAELSADIPDVIVHTMWAPWRGGFVEYAYARGEHLPDDGEIIYDYRLPLGERGYDSRVALGEEEMTHAA